MEAERRVGEPAVALSERSTRDVCLLRAHLKAVARSACEAEYVVLALGAVRSRSELSV